MAFISQVTSLLSTWLYMSLMATLGIDLLSQRNSRISVTDFFLASGALRHSVARYTEGSGAESCHVAQQECYNICRVSRRSVNGGPCSPSCNRLLKTLFPLLPRTTSSSLRASIRKTILTDIKTANSRTANHKLNRAVQAMLFGMVERGMDGEVQGDKGKLRANNNSGPTSDKAAHGGEDAIWAIILTKELWRKGVW